MSIAGIHTGSKRRMRIVHVAFNQARKLPPLVAELRALRGDFEQVLLLPDYDQDHDWLRENLPDVRIVLLRMRSREWSDRQTPLLKLLRFKEFTFRAMAAVRRARGDLLVGHDMPGMLPLLPWVEATPSRVLFHAHELWTEAAEANAPLRPLWRFAERHVVRRVARVIVPEPNRARIMLEEYGAAQLPAVVMNIPPDPPPYTRTDALRRRLGLGADAVVALYQGLLADSRCLVETARAFAALPPRFHFVLAGQGDAAYGAELRAVAEQLQGRVHLLDWMPPEQLREVTASADVGVLFYRNSGRNNYYAAPNKLFEYLFAGLPVVSSAFPGLQMIVEGGGFGACADPADPADIARAIERASAAEAGEEISHRARAAWRWEDQAAVLRALYHDVTRQRFRRADDASAAGAGIKDPEVRHAR